mgnify:CR=1 FL=1
MTSSFCSTCRSKSCRNLVFRASNVAKLLGRCFACHDVGPSNVIPNSAIFDHSASTSVSCCETWFASHVCKKTYTRAFASGSSRYFEYGYGMVFSLKGCVGGGVSIQSSIFSAYWSGGNGSMRSSVFSTCRSCGSVGMRSCLSSDFLSTGGADTQSVFSLDC